MSTKGVVWTGVLLLAGAGVVMVVSSQWEGRARASAPPPVLAPAASIVAAGRVEPAGEEYLVASELDGRLARVVVEEGDRVHAGQVVAELANDDFLARLQIAQGEVAEAQARLDRLRNGSREEERREAQARVQEAEAQWETAQAEVERRRPLLDHAAVSRSEFALAARDQRTAQARLDAAREALALVMRESRPEDIQLAEAQLASAGARVREVQALLDKTRIRAPITGRVLHRWRKSGEPVSAAAQTPILSIGNVSRLMVRVDIDETDIARLHLGQHAYVSAEAYGDRRFTGQVVRIGQALGRKNIHTDDPAERLDKKILEALIELDGGQKLPVGLRVDAYIE